MFGQETAGEYVDDATITIKVKASIARESGLKQIGIETMQNVVKSSRFVDSNPFKTRAGEIAHGISGDKEVGNDLIVQ